MTNRHIRRVQHSIEWLIYFTRFFFRQFYEQRGLQVASSLAYATLLALVPLVTVMFSVLRGLPVFEGVGNTIQTYIFNNFVPAFGETVLSYINSFSQKASQMTVTGLAMIFVVALMLLSTIDNALNSIWHVRNRRSPLARFLVYWTILTMGPVLLGVGLATSSYLLSLPLVSGVDASFGIRERLLAWTPFFTTSIAFTILYVLIPNCFVLRRHALVGGIAAAVLFELAKYAFGVYVRSMTGFQTIYGALAVIPVFLIWIYTSWVVLLLGAHITFCLSAFRLAAEKLGWKESAWSFEEVYQVVYLLWLAQKEGRALSVFEMMKHHTRIPQYQINEIMGYLHSANWVHSTGNGYWILGRDMDEVTVLDLHRIIPRPLPSAGKAETSGENNGGLDRILQDYQVSLEQNLAAPLSSLFLQEKP